MKELYATRPDLSEDLASIYLYAIDGKELVDSLHLHEDDEIILITQGRGSWRIGELEGEFGPGSIGYVRAGTLHAYRSDVQGSGYGKISAYVLHFPRSLLGQSFLDLKEASALRAFFGRMNYGGLVQARAHDRILTRLDTIQGSRGTLRIARVYALFDLLSHLKGWQVVGQQKIGKRKIADEARLKTVFTFVESNFSKTIKREEISALVGMEVSAFSRFFRRVTGQPFVDYLAVIRIRHAALQLSLRRGVSVGRIAKESGFRSIGAFNRQFKRRLGVSPAAYRKQQDAEPVSP